MNNNNYIENRIDPENHIKISIYIEGLFDMTNFLINELKYYLNQENRFFGIVKSYMKSIDDAFCKFNSKLDQNNIDVYGKILFLYKPLLRRNFSRLRLKRLSSGDSIIVILNKILEIMLEEKEGFLYTKELKTVKKIITKLFNNIKNKNKKDALYHLSDNMRSFIKQGLIGKYPLDSFTFCDETTDKKSKLKGGRSIILKETNNLIKEITWTEEI